LVDERPELLTKEGTKEGRKEKEEPICHDRVMT
jgi:hypothetical protein